MTGSAGGFRPGARLGAFLLGATLALAHAADPPPAAPPATPLDVPKRLRLLVIAPHPDDEVLGAGGLMQRVRDQEGRVDVAYLTNGDGYVDGVELETGKLRPRPQDFVDYGEMRLREALRAMAAISIKPRYLSFLGFPDGGLATLLSKHWSSTNPFFSPYTRDDRPPYPQSLNPRAVYSGVALEREIALLITSTSPEWIAVTGPWDIHPDHCAAFHFVARALKRLGASNPSFRSVRVLAYTVHRPDWPVADEGQLLNPPAGVDLAGATWRYFLLSAAELDGKGRALDQYTSQMDIMAVVFRTFVRPNEVFAFYASPPTEPPGGCSRAPDSASLVDSPSGIG